MQDRLGACLGANPFSRRWPAITHPPERAELDARRRVAESARDTNEGIPPSSRLVAHRITMNLGLFPKEIHTLTVDPGTLWAHHAGYTQPATAPLPARVYAAARLGCHTRGHTPRLTKKTRRGLLVVRRRWSRPQPYCDSTSMRDVEQVRDAGEERGPGWRERDLRRWLSHGLVAADVRRVSRAPNRRARE